MLHHVVGIARVADRVRRAHHHLQEQIGYGRAQARQPLPGVLTQKPQHDIERRPAPAFEGKELRRQTGVGRCDGQDVVGPDPRRQQRLLRVAYRRIGEEHALFPAHPSEETLPAELAQPITAAGGDRALQVAAGHRRPGQGRRGSQAPLHLRIPVHDHFSEEL